MQPTRRNGERSSGTLVRAIDDPDRLDDPGWAQLQQKRTEAAHKSARRPHATLVPRALIYTALTVASPGALRATIYMLRDLLVDADGGAVSSASPWNRLSTGWPTADGAAAPPPGWSSWSCCPGRSDADLRHG
jgi:hypothetical protein